MLFQTFSFHFNRYNIIGELYNFSKNILSWSTYFWQAFWHIHPCYSYEFRMHEPLSKVSHNCDRPSWIVIEVTSQLPVSSPVYLISCFSPLFYCLSHLNLVFVACYSISNQCAEYHTNCYLCLGTKEYFFVHWS